MNIKINEIQSKVLNALLDAKEKITVQKIVQDTGVDIPMVMGTLQYGEDMGWVSIEEQQREEIIPVEGVSEIIQKGLPERNILPEINDKGSITMNDLSKIAKDKDIPMNEIIKWGTMRGWVKKEKADLIITVEGKNAINNLSDDEKAINIAIVKGTIFIDELEQQGLDPVIIKKYLKNRNSIAKIKNRTIRLANLTKKGREALSGNIKIIKERNVLTSEDIISGEWKNIELRQYDILLDAEKIYPAKIHLMQKIIQQTRRAFLEMGFTEIISSQVESAFWDFDALFQPQDHPARDMQDTFYLSNPQKAKLPADKLINHVKRTHEDGWETGSKGWGYSWDEYKARQVVLRTHTTACTIRALSENPNPPRKVFCVGKVYRNEAISYKHLPEFFQVDGIIIDENANLATLLGTLKEFYKKMGFNKIKFKPAFFPYTEPSAEVFVYMESKKSWIELGGSGIFRPEVTIPLGCKVPVLAWGLGLDRLAMMRYGFSDIRDLYWNELDKIKEVPLCQ